MEVPAVPVRELSADTVQESSAVIRERVARARGVQEQRYRGDGFFCNSQLKPRHLKTYCVLDSAGRDLLERAMTKLGLSARAYGRVLRVARTIADLAGAERIAVAHVAEAIQYRSLDRRIDF